MDARVTPGSQVHRLRERVEQAEVRHGQEIRADLPGVRVMARRHWFTGRPIPKGDVFFCTMGPVRVREVTSAGDGQPLPEGVTLQGLEVPEEGIYDLLNVLVQSNGDLRVIIDNASAVTQVLKEKELTGRIRVGAV
jgi:hypothetical protein